MADYSFTRDEEPTDTQLSQLMHEVAVDAVARAREADKTYRTAMHEQYLQLKLQLAQSREVPCP